MGQYYNIIIRKVGEGRVHAYDRHINGEYTMAKLMEHSWYLNDMVNAISEKLYYSPSRIAWVGDYADDSRLYKYAYLRKRYEMLQKTDFTLNGRYLVNHTKKLILDCWKYLVDCLRLTEDDDVLHPLPLLTAVGNGRGGGDYHEGKLNSDKVGSWAWDVLEIVEWEHARAYATQGGFKKFEVTFKD